MEATINLNVNAKPQTPKPSIRSNIINSETLSSNVIGKSIIGNNTSRHITFNKTIEYHKVNSYIERKVIDMDNMKLQLEINKILKKQRSMYLSLGIISISIVGLSLIPEIFSKEIGSVLTPLSIAFSLMIGLHYVLGRAK